MNSMETYASSWFVIDRSQWARCIEQSVKQYHPADRWLQTDMDTPPKMSDIRSLHYFAGQTPVGTGKIAILPYADRLRREVANSLLKLLEEPPLYLKLVLISESEHMLVTVRSRIRRETWNPGSVDSEKTNDSDYHLWKSLIMQYSPAIPEERQRLNDLLYITPLLHETVRHGLILEAFSQNNL